MTFWKEAWLRPVQSGEPAITFDASERQLLLQRLKVKSDQTHYFCQSTQLAAATEPFPWKLKPWLLWVAMREVWVGNRSIFGVIGLMTHFALLKLRRYTIGDRVLRGPNKKTPTASLGLEAGDWVEIKDVPEIVQTLNKDQRNRGLSISYAMTKYCGKRFQVAGKIDRMIMETTGEMREVTNTVSLRGMECICYYQMGACPRGDLSYWREIWLKRPKEVREKERSA
jgi:hypothetical protein